MQKLKDSKFTNVLTLGLVVIGLLFVIAAVRLTILDNVEEQQREETRQVLAKQLEEKEQIALEKEKAEQRKREQEKAEQERLAKIEAERIAEEQRLAEIAYQEQLEQERIQQEQLKQEQYEQELAQQTEQTPTTQDIAVSSQGGYTLQAEATAYTSDPAENGGWNVTALGTPLVYGTCAVDPNVIPLGSQIHVEGYGSCLAADTGGAIKGNRIDVLVNSKGEAANWGRRSVQVTVY